MRFLRLWVLPLLFLAGCAEAPSIEGIWKAQDSKDDAGIKGELEIRYDGTYASAAKKLDDPKSGRITGNWEKNSSKKATLLFDIKGDTVPIDIELIDADSLEIKDPAGKQNLIFKRLK